MFGDIKSVDWVSKIQLSEVGEAQLRNTFSHTRVNFHYTEDVGESDAVIESFRQEEDDFVDSYSEKNNIVMGKNRELHKLIAMNDVSGLVNKSNEFSNFLTVSRKFGYSCLYIFHIIF